jgi:hypothetical protein
MCRVKIFFLPIILLFIQRSSWANDSKLLWATVEIGRGWSFADFRNSNYLWYSNKHGKMHLISYAYKGGCYFWSRTSLGVGASAINYYHPDLNLQVAGFVDVRHNFDSYPNFFTYADVGTIFATSEPVLSHANFLANMGVGYRLMFTERISLNILAEYDAFFICCQMKSAMHKVVVGTLCRWFLGWNFRAF